jgi:ADP-ribose pyrophosphatase YjhB (NUDIX family)
MTDNSVANNSSVGIADIKTDLRRGVDHIGVSASFVIHDGDGNILLQKRGQQARDEQGRWDVGGGAIEFGESIEEAVRREIMEELCAVPLDIAFLTVYDAHREHQGKRTHWIAIMHAVKVDPSSVQIGEPHKIDELGWFTSETLPAPLHSQFWKSYQLALDAGIVR